MNHQQNRTLQQTETTLAPDAVLSAARKFFASRHGIYAAFLEKDGPTFASFRGQGGEELVIGVAPAARGGGGGTSVTGSSYMFDQQIARFFATLPSYPTENVATGPAAVAPAVAEGVTPDSAPPGGVRPTGLATAGGTGNAAGSAGGSPA